MGQAAGTLALSLGGRIIGGFLGGPIGGAIGGLAGGLVGSLLFNRKQTPKIPDMMFMSSAYGRPIPFFWGTDRFPGQMIWQDTIQQHKTGIGKGIGPTQYKYTQSAAIAFCQPGPPGASGKLMQLFFDGALVYDSSRPNPYIMKHYSIIMRIYEGTSTQVPDPIMQAWCNVHVSPPNACPGYRNLCYIVFQDLDITLFGNRFPQVTATWSTTATDTTFFQTLLRFTDSASTSVQYQGSEQASVGTDWVRMQVYGLTSFFVDPTQVIRVFSITSGSQVNERKVSDILADVGDPMPSFGMSGLSVCQGSYIYLWKGFPCTVYTIDPDTLHVVFKQEWTPPVWMLLLGGGNPQMAIPFQTITPESVTDLLLFYDTVFVSPYVVNPQTGACQGNVFPLAYRSVFSSSAATIGKVDAVAGTVDIWISNWVEFDTTPGAKTHGYYLYKVTVTGSDPSDFAATGLFVEIGNFNFVDYGDASNTGLFTLTMRYSPADDTILINGYSANGKVAKIDGAGNVTIFTGLINTAWTSDNYAVNDRGYFPMGEITTWFDFDATLGTETLSPATESHSTGIWSMSNSYFNAVAFRDSAITNELMVAYLMRTAGPEAPLADIITDICGRVDLDPTMINVSLVTQTVYGYTIDDGRSAGAALQDLMNMFQIDMVESDYVLKFVPRGQPVVAVLSQAELGSIDDNQAHYWNILESPQLELPLQVNVRFKAPEINFQPGSEYSKRTALPVPTVFSKRVQTIDLPIVSLSDRAKAIADAILYTMWAERETYQTKLSLKHLALDPTDNITVNLDSGDSYTVRIEDNDLGADWSLHQHLASEDMSTYTPSGAPGATYGAPPPTIAPTAYGRLIQWNSPLLQDSDDTGGVATRIYYAAGSIAGSAGWVSGTLFRSTDGVTWTNFASVPTSASWGTALTVLGDTVAKFSTDYLNTVTIALQTGSTPPVSCTYDEMLSGANGALLGQEIIQYRTVTDNLDGTYTLSGILRGRRGTEWATGTHGTGDIFVELVAGDIGGNTLSIPEIGVVEHWKLVPYGRFLDSVPTINFAYNGDDLKPYAPVGHARAPSGSDLVLTWVRRTRLGGLLIDGTDTSPVYETSEAYEVYLIASEGALASFDPTNALTYVRAFTGLTAPTVTYTASMMASDSFTPATDTLYMIVYQLSGVVGRGFLGFKALPAF